MTDEKKMNPMHLASTNNVTLNGAVGSHKLHLYMMVWNKEGDIDKEISMHLSLEEVEELIKGLKYRLVQCYKAKVERI
jgi:hypothetical protein